MSLGDDEHESHFAEADERARERRREDWKIIGAVLGFGVVLFIIANILQGKITP
jgi:uncharacterized membrane protein YhaH (DUF805 family)